MGNFFAAKPHEAHVSNKQGCDLSKEISPLKKTAR